MSLLLIKASAGSGKTFQLVKHYLVCCFASQAHDYYKHILAVTFTIKASIEMKERILTTLKNIINEQQDELVNQIFTEISNDNSINKINYHEFKIKADQILVSILHNFDSFAVATIDSFFNNLVRTFAFDLKLPFKYEIATENNELLQAGIDAIIDQLGYDEVLTKFVISYVSDQLNESESISLAAKLSKLSSFIFNENLTELSNDNSINFQDYEDVKVKLQKENIEFKRKANDTAVTFFDLISNANINREWFIRESLPTYFDKIINKEGFDFTMSDSLMANVREGKWFTSTNAKNKNIVSAFSSIEIELKNIVERIIEGSKKYNKNLVYLKQYVSSALLLKLNTEIQNYKKDNSIITFNDITSKIFEVVAQQHVPFIYERLDTKFLHYYIDEFQDTSIKQFYNFIPLITNCIDTHENLLVGDAKQSIYRFRNGEIEIIKQLPQLIDALKTKVDVYNQLKIIDNFTPQVLQINYRSQKNIIDFNNTFFEFIRQNSLDYLQNIYEDVQQIENKNSDEGYVVIDKIMKCENYESDVNNWVINKIKECINDGYSYCDICILINKNKYASLLSSALIENEIPFVSIASLELQASNSVQVVISYLKYVINVDEKLYAHQLNYYTQKLEVEASKRVVLFESATARSTIASIKKLTLSNAVLQICNLFAINTNDIFLFTLLESIKSNRKLLTLIQFIDWWDEKGYKATVQSVANETSVQLMTYHKSKGLQFKVVLCPFIKSEKSNNEFTIIKYKWSDKVDEIIYPISSKHDILFDLDLSREAKIKKQIDLINSIYVAFTRAEERLYIQFQQGVKSTIPKNNTELSTLQPVHYLDMFVASNQDTSCFELGKKRIYESSSNKNQLVYAVDYSTYKTNWIESNAYFRVSNQNEESRFGVLFHSYLQKIVTLSDFDTQLDTIKNTTALSQKDRQYLCIALDAMRQNNAIHFLFNDSNFIKNEVEIALINQVTIRLDKLIINENYCYVLDYKTGEKNDKHVKQIANYVAILAEIGYVNPIGYLYYTDTNELYKK